MPTSLTATTSPLFLSEINSGKKPLIGGLLVFVLIYTVSAATAIFASASTRATGFAMIFAEIGVATGVLALLTKGAYRKRYIKTAFVSAFAFMIALAFEPTAPSNNAAVASTDAPTVADVATAAPTDAPATAEPTPNQHDIRERAFDYWNPIMTAFASANVMLEGAAYAVGQGDAVQAQQYLRGASQFVDRASDSLSSTFPKEMNGRRFRRISEALLKTNAMESRL